MSTTNVPNGQTFSGNVAANHTLDVLGGGTSANVQLAGTEIVQSDGEANGTTVMGGGDLLAYAGSVVTDTIVDDGGNFIDDGISTGGTILAGGSELVGTMGDDRNTLIFGSVTNQGIGSNSIVGPDGSLTIAATGREADLTDKGGVVNDATTGATLTGPVTLEGTDDRLFLSTQNGTVGPITGLNKTDSIDLAHAPYATTSETVHANSVTFGLSGGGTYTLDITGAGKDHLSFINDGNGGILIRDNAPVCFMPGTAIATGRGPVAVETLAAGDLVLTTDGTLEPVRWLGRQTVSTVFADPLRVSPIRIRAGALAEGIPARDLRVSADHAFLVDGILVHAGALVNGTSVIREGNLPETLTYFHVELASHALLLAENTPAETFIDNVDRLAFDNWDEHQALDDEPPMVEMAYPRAKSHRQVPAAIRTRLAARAALLAGNEAPATRAAA